MRVDSVKLYFHEKDNEELYYIKLDIDDGGEGFHRTIRVAPMYNFPENNQPIIDKLHYEFSGLFFADEMEAIVKVLLNNDEQFKKYILKRDETREMYHDFPYLEFSVEA